MEYRIVSVLTGSNSDSFLHQNQPAKRHRKNGAFFPIIFKKSVIYPQKRTSSVGGCKMAFLHSPTCQVDALVDFWLGILLSSLANGSKGTPGSMAFSLAHFKLFIGSYTINVSLRKDFPKSITWYYFYQISSIKNASYNLFLSSN